MKSPLHRWLRFCNQWSVPLVTVKIQQHNPDNWIRKSVFTYYQYLAFSMTTQEIKIFFKIQQSSVARPFQTHNQLLNVITLHLYRLRRKKICSYWIWSDSVEQMSTIAASILPANPAWKTWFVEWLQVSHTTVLTRLWYRSYVRRSGAFSLSICVEGKIRYRSDFIELKKFIFIRHSLPLRHCYWTSNAGLQYRRGRVGRGLQHTHYTHVTKTH